MVADVWVVTLADGTEVVAKATSYDAALEAAGLEALGAAGGRVPDVLATTPRLLVLEHVTGDGDWASFGARLATIHRTTHDRFGWHQDNVIGPLVQANTWHDDWPGFYVEKRLRPHLDVLPADVRGRLERAIDGPLPDLLDHDPPPSVVHGDLWSGNIVGGSYLVDPAVHAADREFELAFMALFGGIPAPAWTAYEQAWPLDDGWEERRPALQLYHLLVHVALFGSGYLGGIRSRLDRYGW